MKFQRGFTLIELLVVVAIISLLSSVVLASLREARDKAKLTAFQQDVEQFILATELYKADHGGTLPAVNFNSIFGTPTPGSEVIFSSNFSQYLSKFPTPPFSDSSGAILEYDGLIMGGPYTCNGITSDALLYLVVDTTDVNSKYARLEDWGWDWSTSSFGHPCIAL